MDLGLIFLIVVAVVLIPTTSMALLDSWRRNHGRPRW
jgi:hypothetical protein